MSLNAKQYFPAIDGMRAVAVLAVIFFHLELSWFAGGYVGVDIFFVISGYLITRNILFDISLDRFSFKRFYAARFRRLGPAMLVTIGLTLLFGVLLLSPDALIRLSGSAIASVVSLANVRFWMVSGYFDVDASLKPLLHFWSLSVEEQFYVFWPFILVFFVKYLPGKRNGLLLISGLLLASLLAAQTMLNSEPSTVFYWVHFRVYEFAFGALLAWMELQYPSVTNRPIRLNSTLCCAGLLMIGYSVVVYTKATPFPGLASLLPCVGAFILIYTRESPAAKHLLANRPAQAIGKISYSLYLVHWPIWVYFSHWWFKQFQLLDKAALLALILVVGYGLYALVEKKFRYAPAASAKAGNRSLYIVCAFSAIAILATAWNVRTQGGWPWRISNHYAALPPSQITCEYIGGKGHQDCEFGEKEEFRSKVLLLGDSHSMNLRYGLDQFGRAHKINFRSVSFAGCPPLVGVELHQNESSGRDQQCMVFTEKLHKIISTGEYQAVALSARWMWLFEDTAYIPGLNVKNLYLVDKDHPEVTSESSRQVWKSGLSNTVNLIVENGSKAILFSQHPLLRKGIGECDKSPSYLIASERNHRRCDIGVSYTQLMKRLQFTNNTITGLANDKVMVVKPSDHLCDRTAQSCNILTAKGLLYADDNHLSQLGAQFLINSVSKELSEFLD